MIELSIFVFLSLLTLGPALLVVTLKNVFHVGLCLVLSLTGVAGLFAMLGADFLFVAQVLLYVGGIMVVLLFVILLSGSRKDWVVRQFNEQVLVGLLVSAVFVFLLQRLFGLLPDGAGGVSEMAPTTAALGMVLLRDMVLPFEVVGLLLLAALVGAIHFSRGDMEGNKSRS